MALGTLTGPGSPATIRTAGEAPAVLALHGFGGTPREVELVVDVARELGLRAEAPLLPGHGTHAEALAATRFEDWFGAAREALEQLSDSGPCFVAGLSLGSLLSLRLALDEPDRVRAVVLMANPMWLAAPFPDWAMTAVELLGVRDFQMPKLGVDLADAEARRTHLSYDSQPVHAALDIRHNARLLAARAGELTQPALVLHGARDRLCPVANADKLTALLGSEDKRSVVFPRSRHILTRDVERHLVFSELREFFQTHREAERAA